MTAVAELLDGLDLEVTAVPEEDGGGYRLALLIGQTITDPEEAQAVVEGFADRLAQALENDLTAPLRLPAERLALPPTRTT